jgi:hypothetical protein
MYKWPTNRKYNIIRNQGNVSQNHNERPLHTHKDVSDKKTISGGCGEIGTLGHCHGDIR